MRATQNISAPPSPHTSSVSQATLGPPETGNIGTTTVGTGNVSTGNVGPGNIIAEADISKVCSNDCCSAPQTDKAVDTVKNA